MPRKEMALHQNFDDVVTISESTSNNILTYSNTKTSPQSSTGSTPIESPLYIEESIKDLAAKILEYHKNVFKKLKKEGMSFD